MAEDDENTEDESAKQEPITKEINAETPEVENQEPVAEDPAPEAPVEIQLPESPVEEIPAPPIEPEITPVTEPTPEFIEPEPVVEPATEPITVPQSPEPPANKIEDRGMKIKESASTEPKAEESATPPVAPEPAPTPPVAPALHDPKYTKDIPQKILELTAEEINAARLLWARENIAAAQKQGNINRRANMNKIMDEIEAVVRANPMTTTHVIANKVYLSEKSASGYIQKLVHAGRINASGNSRNRRYFI